jgi:hypothetical protein
MTDGGQRLWLHTALLEAPDGTRTAAFAVDERAYPDPEAARAAVREAFDALQLRGVAAEFEAVRVRAGDPASPLPGWSEYRRRLDGGGARPAARPGVLLRVSLSGELDRERLDGLQDALGMRRSGRLSDDASDMFGYRVLAEDAGSGSVTTMRLQRQAARAWTVTVSAQGPAPSGAEVERWRDAVFAAASGAGLSVGEVWAGV